MFVSYIVSFQWQKLIKQTGWYALSKQRKTYNNKQPATVSPEICFNELFLAVLCSPQF